MRKYKAYPIYNPKEKTWYINAIMGDGSVLPIGHNDNGYCIIDKFVSEQQAIGWIKNRKDNLELVENPNN